MHVENDWHLHIFIYIVEKITKEVKCAFEKIILVPYHLSMTIKSPFW